MNPNPSNSWIFTGIFFLEKKGEGETETVIENIVLQQPSTQYYCSMNTKVEHHKLCLSHIRER